MKSASLESGYRLSNRPSPRPIWTSMRRRQRPQSPPMTRTAALYSKPFKRMSTKPPSPMKSPPRLSMQPWVHGRCDGHQKARPRFSENCDGSCLSARWIPASGKPLGFPERISTITPNYENRRKETLAHFHLWKAQHQQNRYPTPGSFSI